MGSHRAPPTRAGRPGKGYVLTGYVLRVATAAALVVDAVVHLRDASFYDANAGSVLTEGQLFRIEAAAAIVAALLVLLWPRWPAWLLAFLVAVTAVAAVVTSTYAHIGPVAGLPSLYEPFWGAPGKVASAIAEGTGAVLALAGLGWAVAGRRRRVPR